MILRCNRSASAMAIALSLGGCASIPADRGFDQVARHAATAGVDAPLPGAELATIDARTAELLARPLDAPAAVALAVLRHPRMRELHAELGIAQADVVEASRLPNPSFAFSTLDPRDGGSSLITRSYGLDVAALLLLPSRQRLAEGELAQVQLWIAAQVIEVAAQAERAWYEQASASQVAALRRAVAEAAEVSAGFAQRLHDAGNLGALELALEQAAAQQAGLDVARAEVAVIEARGALADATGLRASGNWTVLDRLPSPPEHALATEGLVESALDRRLDLASARAELAWRTDAASMASRFRWLGDFELGYERENETDGARLRGPTAAVTIPLFDQGQAEVARARFSAEKTQARLDAMDAGIRNEVVAAAERLESRRAVALRYRDALLPLREAVVARTQEQVNFMFKGAFELILSRREQYDAYQAYLEAVRDYWLARIALRLATGGPLPGDEQPPAPTLGTDAILPPATGNDATEHQHHHGDRP